MFFLLKTDGLSVSMWELWLHSRTWRRTTLWNPNLRSLRLGWAPRKTRWLARKCWMGRVIWWFRWREHEENLWCLVHVGCLDESSTADVHREAFVHRADSDLINMQRQIKTAEERHRKNQIWCLGLSNGCEPAIGQEAFAGRKTTKSLDGGRHEVC